MKPLPPAVAEATGHSRAIHSACRCAECRALDAEHPRDGHQLALFHQATRPRSKRRRQQQEKRA